MEKRSKALVKVTSKKDTKNQDEILSIGWKEWCALPDLHLPAIKAKIDTGAKTSALHAYHITPFYRKKKLWVRFELHPLQRNRKFTVARFARVVDQRQVTSSNGHQEMRYVIASTLTMDDQSWPIELTLTNRENMLFRMLLGRDALKNNTVIHPGSSYKLGKMTNKKALRQYKNQGKKT